jgi:hypothetical protein
MLVICKECEKCGKMKNITSFHLCETSPDGFSGTCVQCKRKYDIEWAAGSYEDPTLPKAIAETRERIAQYEIPEAVCRRRNSRIWSEVSAAQELLDTLNVNPETASN